MPWCRATTVCLLVLSVVLLGLCPLAPAIAAPPARVPPCHANLPANSHHSCCVVVHHQPALVRAMVENAFAVATPLTVLSAPVRKAHAVPVAASNNSPSPPLLYTALRI